MSQYIKKDEFIQTIPIIEAYIESSSVSKTKENCLASEFLVRTKKNTLYINNDIEQDVLKLVGDLMSIMPIDALEYFALNKAMILGFSIGIRKNNSFQACLSSADVVRMKFAKSVSKIQSDIEIYFNKIANKL